MGSGADRGDRRRRHELDNVVAAANGSIPLLVIRLAISIPLIVAGAALIMALLTRLPADAELGNGTGANGNGHGRQWKREWKATATGAAAPGCGIEARENRAAVQIEPQYRTKIKSYVTEHKVRPVTTKEIEGSNVTNVLPTRRRTK